MSEEDLALLITLDDPGNAPEEDIFNHLQVNNLQYWLGQQFLDHRSRLAFHEHQEGHNNEMLFAFI